MNFDYKEIKRGEKHLGAYTFLDLYTTYDGETFQLYKKAGTQVKEIREAQDRLPASLYIKRDDAIKEVRLLQQEMDKELDRLMEQDAPPAVNTHRLIESALEVAADGLTDLSHLGEKDPEKTAEVLGGIKDMTNSIVSKCLVNESFLENMLAVARKDFNTFHHSVKVAMYAMVYTSHQGFTRQDLEPFVLAATLHDIGVVFLPDRIIKNTGKLSNGEYEEMKKHPRLGHEVLRDAFKDPRIARVSLEHHERLDGSGYPIGHSDIHEWSQIIGIIEVFDGMVSWRPHRPAPGPFDAIKVLVKMAQNGEIPKPMVDAFCTSLVGKMID